MTMFMALFIGLAGLGGNKATSLTVDASPKDAQIYLDGKRISRGKRISVSAGKHTIKAARKGYKSASKTILAKGKSVSIKLSLSKLPQAKKPVTQRGKTPVGRKPTKPKEPARGGRRPVRTISKPDAKDDKGGKGSTITARKPKNPRVKPVRGTRLDDARKPEKPVRRNGTVRTDRPDSRKGVAPRRRRVPPRGNLHGRTASDNKGSSGGGVSGRTTSSSRGSLKPLAVVSFLVGGVAIAGGVVTGRMADDRAEDFNTSRVRDKKLDYKQEAEDLSLGSNVLYGVGATGIALGALLWSMDSAYRAEVAPLPGGGAYVGIGGSF